MTLYQPGHILLNKYRIETEPPKKGGFAYVYRAVHLELQTPRALKILHKDAPGLDSSEFGGFQERFTLEAQLGDQLNHPHIVRVYDFERVEDTLMLVMEYCPGGSLLERIKPEGRARITLPVEAAVKIGVEVAQGLAELHQLGAVHSDLKPSNILFDQKGRAKLADMGLAQIPDGMSMRSMLGSLAKPHPGTPGYMSPEQEDQRVYLRPPSDIYALGCVLFEALTGRNPQDLRPGIAPLSLRSEIPGWLDQLILRMLAEDPKQRPWDAGELLQLLQGGAEQRERERREAEAQERQRKAAEEKARREAEEKSRREAEAREQQRKAEEEKARREAEDQEQQRKEAEEKARREAEERRRREAIEQERQRLEAEEKARRQMTITLAPGVEMEFVRVPAGEFWMGSNEADKAAYGDEKPQHKVFLDEYWIGKYPVTNRQYQAFIQQAGQAGGKALRLSHSWSFEVGQEQHPAVKVSWNDALTFCQWASQVSGQKIRLPGEAEWEKAARGADQRLYPWGNQPPDRNLANFNQQFNETTPVGQFSPQGDSPYGCADLAGNVWEWTADWYDANYYQNSPAKNPTGAASGEHHVLRGGSWNYGARNLRAALRDRDFPDLWLNYYGFRCAR